MGATLRAMQGGCQCGAVRYEIDASEILTLYCCHCTECQHQSSSGFGMSMLMRRAGFRLLQGELRTWTRVADNGNVNRANFCAACGTRILHDDGDENDTAAIVSLKAGSLDETGGLTPVGHIWTRSAQAWLRLPDDTLRYEMQPASLDALYAAYRDRRD